MARRQAAIAIAELSTSPRCGCKAEMEGFTPVSMSSEVLYAGIAGVQVDVLGSAERGVLQWQQQC